MVCAFLCIPGAPPRGTAGFREARRNRRRQTRRRPSVRRSRTTLHPGSTPPAPRRPAPSRSPDSVREVHLRTSATELGNHGIEFHRTPPRRAPTPASSGRVRGVGGPPGQRRVAGTGRRARLLGRPCAAAGARGQVAAPSPRRRPRRRASPDRRRAGARGVALGRRAGDRGRAPRPRVGTECSRALRHRST